MDIQQIKLLAARIRALLQKTDCPVNHSQSLDISASLAGLRNWPEVQSFPKRLAAAQLDAAAIARLSFRLHRRFNITFTRAELHAALDPEARPELPQIWPTGPASGVYLTVEQRAIDILVTRFEEESDGALIYAESAGNSWEGSIIDLGDNGLWSSGLQHAPSGTLIVVGPVDFEQSSWDDSAQRLVTACSKSDLGHRVAVLVRTPDPDRLCEDAHLMVRTTPESYGVERAFRGIVTVGGELLERTPFIRPTTHPAFMTQRRHSPNPAAIPMRARQAIKDALRGSTKGLVLVGGEMNEQIQMRLAEGVLALTDHCGPAARIMPRTRSTYAKYWDVPDAVKELPFLPSVQSAYEQGFRRMVLHANYSDADLLLDYPDVLFIGATWGSHVAEVFMSGARLRRREELAILDRVLAILAVSPLSADGPELLLCDLYTKTADLPSVGCKYEDVIAFIESGRVIEWEKELAEFVDRFGEEQVLQVLRQEHDASRILDRLLRKIKDRVETESEHPVLNDRVVETRSKMSELIKRLNLEHENSHD